MRNNFRDQKAVSLDSLLLDEHNPRLGFAKDQDACLEKMIALGQPFFAIAKDIAEYGLTIEDVVVIKQKGKYIVKDGNRRVSALKLLNRPHLCKEKSVRERFEKLAVLAERNGNLFHKIDCKVGSDIAAVNEYILRAHTGENGGIGRKNWESLQQEYYQLSIGEKGNYWRAAKLTLWADENDILIPEKFAVTTLGRFFGAMKNIKLLGFEFDEEENIVPCVPLMYALSVAKRIISDVELGVVHVKRDERPGTLSLMASANRDYYIELVRQDVGLTAFEASDHNRPSLGGPVTPSGGVEASQYPSSPGSPSSTQGAGLDAGQKVDSQPANASSPAGGKSGSIPTKHSANRAKYVTKGGHPLTLPKDEQKLRDIYKELTVLEKCPVAGMMLVRAFIEGTFKAYVKKFKLIRESNFDNASIKEMLRAVKTKLVRDEVIVSGSDYYLKVDGLLEDALVSIPSMQKYIHSEIFNPKDENVKKTWDDFYHLLKMLWDQVEAES